MDQSDAAFLLQGARRDLERSGVNPSQKVSMAFLVTMLSDLHKLIGDEAAERRKLEKRIEGMQTAVDHQRRHALTFMGDWQVAQSYPAGAVVRHVDGVFTALTDMAPGKAEPNRQGSRWDRII